MRGIAPKKFALVLGIGLFLTCLKVFHWSKSKLLLIAILTFGFPVPEFVNQALYHWPEETMPYQCYRGLMVAQWVIYALIYSWRGAGSRWMPWALIGVHTVLVIWKIFIQDECFLLYCIKREFDL